MTAELSHCDRFVLQILKYLLFDSLQKQLANQPLPGEDPGWFMSHSFHLMSQGPLRSEAGQQGKTASLIPNRRVEV